LDVEEQIAAVPLPKPPAAARRLLQTQRRTEDDLIGISHLGSRKPVGGGILAKSKRLISGDLAPGSSLEASGLVTDVT
jgi:hypothetical protein